MLGIGLKLYSGPCTTGLERASVFTQLKNLKQLIKGWEEDNRDIIDIGEFCNIEEPSFLRLLA